MVTLRKFFSRILTTFVKLLLTKQTENEKKYYKTMLDHKPCEVFNSFFEENCLFYEDRFCSLNCISNKFFNTLIKRSGEYNFFSHFLLLFFVLSHYFWEKINFIHSIRPVNFFPDPHVITTFSLFMLELDVIYNFAGEKLVGASCMG
jgi:hypothetical protein